MDRTGEVLAHPERVVGDDVATFRAPPALQDPSLTALIERLSQGGRAQQRAALEAAQPAAALAGEPPRGRRYRLFVSQAMPAGALGATLEAAIAHPDVTIVLRGVAPNQTLQQLLAALQRALPASAETPPAIEIDPPRFTKDRVARVPVLIVYDDDVEVARVDGFFEHDWLAGEVDAGRTGPRGQHGPTYDVLEPDLEGVLKSRAARLDWQAMRAKAMTSAWTRVPEFEMPRSDAARTRELDPTVTISQTITAPDGTVIARAGDRFNPLQRVPFHTRLVVFDATDAEQLAFALAQKAEQPDSMLLFTKLAAAPSWDAYNALVERAGGPVYVLTAAIRDRFGVERLPTVIEPSGDHYVIREPAMTTSKEKGNARTQ